ncbi:MAG: helix-turn-helix domain-containing protein [Acidobacteria bacterium]|nr:helix-turn-helix domain-containing protein [Acidobacteriota bacterium]
MGRSLLVANMGIQMARLGKKVAVADLDFEGANLHTYLGIGTPSKSLEKLSAKSGEAPLASLLLDTSVSGLKLLSGSHSPLPQEQRDRILERFSKQAGSLGVDLVLVDCGSGRGGEVLELFQRSGGGILVATPEPASVESVFLFMESFLEKALKSALSADELEKLDIARCLDEGSSEGLSSFRSALERLRIEGETALVERVLKTLGPLRLRLILNQVRGDADSEIAPVLQSGLEKYFGLEMTSLGCVEYDLSVLQAVQKRKPLSQQYPNSPATQGIERAVSALIAPFRGRENRPLPLHRSLGEVDHYRMLEVEPGASSREIQLVYQILKRAYDPENIFRHPLLSNSQIERISTQLESAYRTLIFLETRTDYDRKLVSLGVLRPEQVKGPEMEGSGASRGTASVAPESVSPLPVSARDDAGKAPAPDPAKAAPTVVPGDGLPVTGASLRQHREERKLTLETIVEKTKIRPAILEALEEDRFADLPEPVFLRGFLRQLAVCLGLDPTVVCREYMRRLEPETPEAEARPR